MKKESSEQLRAKASAALREANQLLQQASLLLKKNDLEGARALQQAASDKQNEFSELMKRANHS